MTEWEFEREFSDVKAEWVDGEVIVMAAASGEHADINGWLYRLLWEFVDHYEAGLVRALEYPMRLASLRTWRCPDLMFISKAKLSRVNPMYLDGAADLAIEIVSPDSEARDWREKYELYQSAGLREYWIVDPLSRRMDAYTLGRSKRYSLIHPDNDGRIHSKVLKGLYIRPKWLWQSPLPKLAGVLKELKLR